MQGHIAYALDPDWSLTLADLTGAAAGRMQPVTEQVPDFGYTKARIWLRLRVENATAGQRDWRIHFRENFKQLFDVFVVHEDGRIAHVLSQDMEHGFASRPVPFPELVAPFVLEPGEAAAIYVRFWSGGSSSLAFSVETADSFAAIAAARTAKNFVYYGMTLLLIIIALGALPVFRHPIFLAYAAYAGSSLLFLMHADGVAFQYLWPAAPHFNGVASVVTGSAIIIAGTLYARVFLQTARLHPWLDRLLVGMVLVTLGIDVTGCWWAWSW